MTVVATMSVSLDGYGTGVGQTEAEPFGDAGEVLHRWMFETPDENRAEIDAIIAAGAFIMGRNMFGPVRGEWTRDWRGWWGPDPPYHRPVFVLTHHPRPVLEFENGTSFHFVDGSPEQVLEQARTAAGGKDVKVNGGVSTVRAFWKARLLDELHLVMSPVFVGEGERLLGGLGVEQDYQVAGFEASEAAVHYRIVKKR